MSLAASIFLGLLVLAAVVAYLVFALPRLTGWMALGATVLCVGVLVALSAALAPLGSTAPMMGAVALIAGHVGWALGWRAKVLARAARRLQQSTSTRPARRTASPRSRGASSERRQPRIAADAPPAVASPRSASTEPVAEPRPTLPAGSGAATKPLGTAADAAVKPANVPAPTGLPMADLQRTSLGRYRIDRAIGRGSMGAVFLGLDTMLGRQVAIKTMALGQEFAGAELAEAKQRFFREAETAGRLQHRDIVTVYDVGEEEDLAYIAMEFLKGHDLQRHTQAANLLPVPVTLRIGARVAEALAYAHSQGVVHRDVKPANVMLHLPSGAVKVTDFGIARVTDASRTRTGMVLGTPSFMSPEHLAGRRVDGRTDLYSLGVMLFQLLSGQLPFQADSMARLMYQIANDPAPDLRSLRPDLPEALTRVVARALEKNPVARHADGAQMAAELRAADAAGSGPLWAGTPPVAADPVTAAADKAAPPFASTVRFARDETGHNSTP